jgi:ketosteroid isomerase-like protein
VEHRRLNEPRTQEFRFARRPPGRALDTTEVYVDGTNETRRERVPTYDRLRLVRDAYGAYESGDRRVVEELLTDDFTFYSPADVGIDRARYFERCWPNSELIEAFDFKRLVESGDEVIVTYESKRTDGSRFRNTEILTFEGDKICSVEVYFGRDLE